MSGKGSQLPLFTSPENSEGSAPSQGRGTPFTTRSCDISGCNLKPTVFFDPIVVRPSLWPIVFKDDISPHGVGTCRVHYGQIRWRHGTDLAFKMRGNKIRAYVKDVWI